MTKIGISLVAAAIMLSGMHAVADDTQGDQAKKEQMMKDCMSRMSAKNDGASKDQMHTACVAEINKGMDMGKAGMGMGREGMGMGKDHMNPPKQ